MVVGSLGERLERELYGIPEVDTDRSFMELSVVSSEIDGVEVKVLPDSYEKEEQSGRYFSEWQIPTETNTAILYKKIAGRMIDRGQYEIRGIFDLYMASTYDRPALLRAIEPIPKRTLNSVATMLEILPRGWWEGTPKPLVGVSDPPTDREMIEDVCRMFRSS